jgi:outer membrane protein W
MKTLSRNPILAAISFAAAITVAPTSYALQDQGDKEIEFSGGFSHASGSDVGTINADVSLGYYAAPRLSLGIRQTLSYAFVDDAPDSWTASTIPFVNYYFETSNQNFRPFIGAFVGAAYNEDDTTGTAGPAVGFKYFLSDNTAVVTRLRYEWYFEELTLKDSTNTSDGNYIATVGMSYSWK